MKTMKFSSAEEALQFMANTLEKKIVINGRTVNAKGVHHLSLDMSQATAVFNELQEELYDVSANGVVVTPNSDDVALGYDTEISVSGGEITLSGTLGPSASGGTVVIKAKKEDVSSYYSFELDVNDDVDVDDVIQQLNKANVVVAR